jgi:hypothetical protein
MHSHARMAALRNALKSKANEKNPLMQKKLQRVF